MQIPDLKKKYIYIPRVYINARARRVRSHA